MSQVLYQLLSMTPREQGEVIAKMPKHLRQKTIESLGDHDARWDAREATNRALREQQERRMLAHGSTPAEIALLRQRKKKKPPMRQQTQEEYIEVERDDDTTPFNSSGELTSGQLIVFVPLAFMLTVVLAGYYFIALESLNSDQDMKATEAPKNIPPTRPPLSGFPS